MKPFPTPLLDAVLIRRYKRFLADVRIGRRLVTVHCGNPGRMTGMADPGSAVLLSDSGNPRRKLRYSWELVKVGRCWVGVNTQLGNRAVGHWLRTGQLLSLPETVRASIRAEVTVGRHRFDFAAGDTLIEVKTVTLKSEDGLGAFPDTTTERGRRHMEALRKIAGRRRVVVFFVARPDVTAVRPADEIDPAYGKALRHAVAKGVEVVAVGARFSRRGVARGGRLEVVL